MLEGTHELKNLNVHKNKIFFCSTIGTKAEKKYQITRISIETKLADWEKDETKYTMRFIPHHSFLFLDAAAVVIAVYSFSILGSPIFWLIFFSSHRVRLLLR